MLRNRYCSVLPKTKQERIASGPAREQHQTRRQLLYRRKTTPHRVFQNPAVGRQWNVFAIDPEERQSEQPTWLPILLSVCVAELEDVGGDDQHQI